jgi:hypothetical protein
MENNNKNIEKYLSEFKIKGPEHDLRDKILLKAKSAWEKKNKFRWGLPGFNFRKLINRYTYAVVIILLINIISLKIDSILTDNLIRSKEAVVGDTGGNINMKNLCLDIGVDYKIYKVFSALYKEKYDSKKFYNSGEILYYYKRYNEDIEIENHKDKTINNFSFYKFSEILT